MRKTILVIISIAFLSCNDNYDLNKIKSKSCNYTDLPKNIRRVLIDSLNVINNNPNSHLINLDNYEAYVKINNDTYAKDVLLDDVLYIKKKQFYPLPGDYSTFILSDSLLYMKEINVKPIDSSNMAHSKFRIYDLKNYIKN